MTIRGLISVERSWKCVKAGTGSFPSSCKPRATKHATVPGCTLGSTVAKFSSTKGHRGAEATQTLIAFIVPCWENSPIAQRPSPKSNHMAPPQFPWTYRAGLAGGAGAGCLSVWFSAMKVFTFAATSVPTWPCFTRVSKMYDSVKALCSLKLRLARRA